jgi:hypothetical protein
MRVLISAFGYTFRLGLFKDEPDTECTNACSEMHTYEKGCTLFSPTVVMNHAGSFSDSGWGERSPRFGILW